MNLTNEPATRMVAGVPVAREGLLSGDGPGLQIPRTCAGSSDVAATATPANAAAERVGGSSDGSRSPDAKGAERLAHGSSRVAAPLRSADLTDRMAPIATRLPAGLSEAELIDGYALCAGGAS